MRLSKMIGAVLVSATLWSAPAVAQPIQVDDQLRATARNLADEGMHFFEERKYADALDRFDRASAIIKAPTITLHAARSLDKLGRLIEASERYREVINTQLEEKGPEAFRAAQEAARAELQALQPRIPSLEIAVEGTGAGDAVVKLDGRVIPKALVGVKTLLNPGEHRVEATSGALSDLQEVTILEKQAARVVLKLQQPGEDVGQIGDKPNGQTSLPGPDKPKPESMNGMRIGAYAALGVGGVFTIVGIAASVSALGKQDELTETCPAGSRNEKTGACIVGRDTEFTNLYNDFVAQRNLSIAGVVLGGVGLATGAALFILSKPKPEAQSKATSGLTIQPWVGLGSAGFRGTF